MPEVIDNTRLLLRWPTRMAPNINAPVQLRCSVPKRSLRACVPGCTQSVVSCVCPLTAESCLDSATSAHWQRFGNAVRFMAVLRQGMSLATWHESLESLWSPTTHCPPYSRASPTLYMAFVYLGGATVSLPGLGDRFKAFIERPSAAAPRSMGHPSTLAASVYCSSSHYTRCGLRLSVFTRYVCCVAVW